MERSAKCRCLSISVGVLGHVDSGKTSLVACLSTILSTAALDKHPQSKERGITLDLGFSTFTMPMPAEMAALHGNRYDSVQFTLVDCPGHASLIRTIIGGVQIIDMAMLVVDINKGLQTQTAECLVVAEVSTPRLLVVLNKVDMLQPESERPKAIKRAKKRLAATFDMTKFAGVEMVPVAAKPGSQEGVLPFGIEQLQQKLLEMVPVSPRRAAGPFLFAVDHCFPIKGQGTVLTGTVLQGSVSVNDMVELPAQALQRPVRSMQMFRRPTNKASAGDRVGVCLTQLDAASMERGLLAAPGTVPTFSCAVARVEKIRFYAGQVASKTKYHISIGHTTVMAHLAFFGLPDGQGVSQEVATQQMIENLSRMALGTNDSNSSTSAPASSSRSHHGSTAKSSGQPNGNSSSSSRNAVVPGLAAVDSISGFDMSSREYLHQEELHGLEGRPLEGSAAARAVEAAVAAVAPKTAGLGGGGQDTAQVLSAGAPNGAQSSTAAVAPEEEEEGGGRHYGPQWALLRFETPVTAPQDSLVIGSRFDVDIHGEACRLAFYGRIVQLVDASKPEVLRQLRVFKAKERWGTIERILPDGETAVVRGLCKKETDVTIYTNLKVTTGRGESGIISGSFGKSGKLRVTFSGGLAAAGRSASDNQVLLRCKRYVYQTERKRLVQ